MILVFSVLGIIGLEYVAYNLFHSIVDRMVIGFQKWFCVGAYVLIMATICWGIQSHYAGDSGYTAFYYSYVLPAAPIGTLLLVLLIYLIDPLKQADEDEATLALEAHVLKKRLANEKVRYQVREQREWMKLDWATFQKRMHELWKIAESGATKRLLAAASEVDFKARLEKVHKLRLPAAQQVKGSRLNPLRWFRRDMIVPHTESTGSAIPVGDLDGNGIDDLIEVVPSGDGAAPNE